MRIVEESPERLKKCKGCRTVFAYTGKDVRGSISSSYVTCPVCFKDEFVSIFDRKVKK